MSFSAALDAYLARLARDLGGPCRREGKRVYLWIYGPDGTRVSLVDYVTGTIRLTPGSKPVGSIW